MLTVYCLLQQQINIAKRAAAFSEYDSMIGLLQEILSGAKNFPFDDAKTQQNTTNEDNIIERGNVTESFMLYCSLPFAFPMFCLSLSDSLFSFERHKQATKCLFARYSSFYK